MDRTYVIPCQKNDFHSCEGCPASDCGTKHNSAPELTPIHC